MIVPFDFVTNQKYLDIILLTNFGQQENEILGP